MTYLALGFTAVVFLWAFDRLGKALFGRGIK